MKILSMAWVIYDERIEEFSQNCTGGGGGVMIKNICKYIGKKADSYLFVGKFKLPQIKMDEYTIVNTDIDFPNGMHDHIEQMLYAFERALRQISPDIVNVHGGGVLAKKCIKLCMEKQIPLVYTDHLYVGQNEKFDGAERDHEWDDAILTIPGLNIVAVSTGMRTKILKDYPQLSPDSVKAIVNGTDFTAEKKESDFKERYGLAGKKVLLCAGSLHSRKNQLQLVKIFPMLKDEVREQTRIIFCGKDSQAYPLRAVLQEKILESGLEEELQYIGSLSNEDMKKMYSVTDGLILPSYAEGLSLVELEAIAYGIPVIMFRDLECSEDLDDKNVVSFAEERTDESLAEAVNNWFYKKWDRDYIREYSRQFTMEKVADNYLAYYENIINKGKAENKKCHQQKK